MLRVIDNCPQPSLAKMQGDCYAGGLGLVVAGDIAIGADSANFCLAEVKLGLIPATILPYVVRHRRALWAPAKKGAKACRHFWKNASHPGLPELGSEIVA
jgi:enoyl-CoA hydratase/carnithine racemase